MSERAVHNCNALVLTVGLPRSGKTTWARTMGLPIVSPDELRQVLHGTAFWAETEPLVWAMARVMVRALFRAGHRAVVLDACSISPKRRAEWLDNEWVTCAHLVDTPMKVCIERALAADRHELVEVIQRMELERNDAELMKDYPAILTHLDLVSATEWRHSDCSACMQEAAERAGKR